MRQVITIRIDEEFDEEAVTFITALGKEQLIEAIERSKQEIVKLFVNEGFKSESVKEVSLDIYKD